MDVGVGVRTNAVVGIVVGTDGGVAAGAETALVAVAARVGICAGLSLPQAFMINVVPNRQAKIK